MKFQLTSMRLDSQASIEPKYRTARFLQREAFDDRQLCRLPERPQLTNIPVSEIILTFPRRLPSSGGAQ
jgi:hypothetical protein